MIWPVETGSGLNTQRENHVIVKKLVMNFIIHLNVLMLSYRIHELHTWISKNYYLSNPNVIKIWVSFEFYKQESL